DATMIPITADSRKADISRLHHKSATTASASINGPATAWPVITHVIPAAAEKAKPKSFARIDWADESIAAAPVTPTTTTTSSSTTTTTYSASSSTSSSSPSSMLPTS